MTKIRIQKLLSETGVASRRAIEEMVLEGRITVNSSPVTDLPCFVDPETDSIRVDGRIVRKRPGERLYFLLNKPRGVVCTQSDPSGRPKAVDMVPEIPGGRVYCVGRLDVDSTGLILLTNDGALTQYLTHPRHGVPKQYVVEIDCVLTAEQIAQFKSGMYVGGKRTGGAAIKVLRKSREHSLIEVTLTEGRNREIRRILLQFGAKVKRLKRVGIGPITDRGLKIGNFRVLRPVEVAKLQRCGKKKDGGKERTVGGGKSSRSRKRPGGARAKTVRRKTGKKTER